MHFDVTFIKYYHLSSPLFTISAVSVTIYSTNGPIPCKPL